jgi:hypothetical protein
VIGAIAYVVIPSEFIYLGKENVMKREIKIIILLLLVIIMLAASETCATPANSNSMIHDDIEYYIQTNKSVYILGESVEMLYRVTNLGDEDVTFWFPHTPVWNFWVEKDGENIWRAVNRWYGLITEFTLSPGEPKEFPDISLPYIWNMRDSENNLVDAGKYNVIGGLYDGSEHYDYTKVAVLIKIIPEPLSADIDIHPRTLNMASEGKWITCHIWLPEDYNVADIDPNSIVLEEEIEPDWLWFDEQDQVLMAKFARSELDSILETGQIELTIRGELTDGTPFKGTDAIRVIDKHDENK